MLDDKKLGTNADAEPISDGDTLTYPNGFKVELSSNVWARIEEWVDPRESDSSAAWEIFTGGSLCAHNLYAAAVNLDDIRASWAGISDAIDLRLLDLTCAINELSHWAYGASKED